jgi:adenine-specific DNA methylase
LSINIFLKNVNRLCEASTDLFSRIEGTNNRATTILADARLIKLDKLDGSVDAVVTSPPYLSAQDYYRSSKLLTFA